MKILLEACRGFAVVRTRSIGPGCKWGLTLLFGHPLHKNYSSSPVFTRSGVDSIFLSLKIIYVSFGTNAETYSEICQTSKLERFAQIINSIYSLTIFEKRFILDV